MFAKLDIDHHALFLDLVEGRVRAHGVATAFRRGSGLLMRRDQSSVRWQRSSAAPPHICKR